MDLIPCDLLEMFVVWEDNVEGVSHTLDHSSRSVGWAIKRNQKKHLTWHSRNL